MGQTIALAETAAWHCRQKLLIMMFLFELLIADLNSTFAAGLKQ
jgi:hypothetical protein